MTSQLIDAYLAEYEGLWNEVNTRLQIREGILSIGLTVVLSVMSAGILGASSSSNDTLPSLQEALLLTPLLALAFQLILLRHFSRIATISLYMYVDLSERVEKLLPNTVPLASGPFGWIPFLHRGIIAGPARAELILGSIEFTIFPAIALFAPLIYFTTAEPFRITQYFALAETAIALLMIPYTINMRRRFVDAQVLFAYPDRLARHYYRTLAKGYRDLANYMWIPEKRDPPGLPKTQEILRVQSVDFDSSVEGEKVSYIVKGYSRTSLFRRQYTQRKVILSLSSGRWYIEEILPLQPTQDRPPLAQDDVTQRPPETA